MKTNHIRLLLAALVGLFCVIFCFAQDPTSAPPISEETQSTILNFLTGLVVKYPVISSVLAVIGLARVWVKPVCSIIHSIVDLTPSKTDDGWWAIAQDFFTNNPVGKFIAYLVDWLGSVKLVPPAKASE